MGLQMPHACSLSLACLPTAPRRRLSKIKAAIAVGHGWGFAWFDCTDAQFAGLVAAGYRVGSASQWLQMQHARNLNRACLPTAPRRQLSKLN